jgi:hypothetical protein
VLSEYDSSGTTDKALWVFFINPNSLNYRDAAEYTPIAPLAASAKEQSYLGATGASLSIPDLRFETWCLGRSVRPVIEGVRSLLRAKVEQNQFAPPVLMFRMGTTRFGPCVLTQVEWDETKWLAGEPAGVRMSLALQEVPKPLTTAQKAAQAQTQQQQTAQQNTNAQTPSLPLTQRQQATATQQADSYLLSNSQSWSANVQAAISQKNYSLSVNPSSGDVQMTSSGQSLGTIGRSLGESGFRTGSGFTTLPLQPGAKLS